MQQIIGKLKDWGCDTAGALERMAGDEAFFLECVEEVIADPCFAELGQALGESDASKAFDAAHTLKGVLANVGLTPLYNKVVEIVEPLRTHSDGDLTDLYRQLMQRRSNLERLLHDE